MFYEFIRHISVSVLLHAERNGTVRTVNEVLEDRYPFIYQ